MSPEVLNSLDKNAQVCAKNVSSLMATLQTGLKEVSFKKVCRFNIIIR